MRNLKNTVRLIGNVGMDPELKTLTNGNTVARFSHATSEGFINKEGEKVVDTQWHRIVELEFLNDTTLNQKESISKITNYTNILIIPTFLRG